MEAILLQQSQDRLFKNGLHKKIYITKNSKVCQPKVMGWEPWEEGTVGKKKDEGAWAYQQQKGGRAVRAQDFWKGGSSKWAQSAAFENGNF